MSYKSHLNNLCNLIRLWRASIVRRGLCSRVFHVKHRKYCEKTFVHFQVFPESSTCRFCCLEVLETRCLWVHVDGLYVQCPCSEGLWEKRLLSEIPQLWSVVSEINVPSETVREGLRDSTARPRDPNQRPLYSRIRNNAMLFQKQRRSSPPHSYHHHRELRGSQVQAMEEWLWRVGLWAGSDVILHCWLLVQNGLHCFRHSTWRGLIRLQSGHVFHLCLSRLPVQTDDPIQRRIPCSGVPQRTWLCSGRILGVVGCVLESCKSNTSIEECNELRRSWFATHPYRPTRREPQHDRQDLQSCSRDHHGSQSRRQRRHPSADRGLHWDPSRENPTETLRCESRRQSGLHCSTTWCLSIQITQIQRRYQDSRLSSTRLGLINTWIEGCINWGEFEDRSDLRWIGRWSICVLSEAIGVWIWRGN